MYIASAWQCNVRVFTVKLNNYYNKKRYFFNLLNSIYIYTNLYANMRFRFSSGGCYHSGEKKENLKKNHLDADIDFSKE